MGHLLSNPTRRLESCTLPGGDIQWGASRTAICFLAVLIEAQSMIIGALFGCPENHFEAGCYVNSFSQYQPN